MKFGLIFFSSTESVYPDDKYKLVLESVRYADQRGFSSIWIPERHFTRDGWLYPNPAVLLAALARETQQIALRAGSVVMPLHDPIRVAEEWAMVDNLSHGRVGISFASGWHSNDFVFFPEKFADRHEEMYRGIETVRQLWAGETIGARGVDGREVVVRIFPTPIQQSLPVWITAAGNPQTFARAGELGANLLTHLFNQSIEELASKIAIYREALARHGHRSNAGLVTVMLHTFVHSDSGATFNRARQSFSHYLRSASYLLNSVAANRGQNVDFASLSRADLDDYMNFIFERLVSGDRVLFGTPESCSSLVTKLAAIGVDELACQLDFLTEPDSLLESLPYLNQLKDACQGVVFENSEFISPSASDFQSIDLGFANLEDANPTTGDSLDEISARCSEEVSTEDFYDRFQRAGLQLNAAFRGIEALRRCDGEALASVELPAVNDEAHVYTLHPGVLDVCLQTLSASVPSFFSSNVSKALYLFVGMSHFEIHGPLSSRFWCHAKLPLDHASSVETFKGRVRLLDDEGTSLLEITGLRLRRVENAVGIQAEENRSLSESQAADNSVRAAILSSVGAKRLRLLETYLRERVAAVLRLPIDKVNIQEPLNNLGIDSLMAVELKKRIEVDLGVSIRIVYFLLGHNVVHLAVQTNEQLSEAGETLNDDQLELRSPQELLASIDELSDAEVDSLLASVIRNEEVKIEL